VQCERHAGHDVVAGVNYYERHLGDYARDTGHLSMTEHGAYTLLLDRYYATEKGIPADKAHRLARARTEEERAAVDAVLEEFFRLVEGCWVHARVEAEIEKASGRINAARENGRKGGRPRKEETQQKPSGFSPGYEKGTQQEPTEKLTNHQTPPKSERETHTSTPAGDAGRALRSAGCPTVSMTHPEFQAALTEGVTPEEFVDAVDVAKANGVQGAGLFLYAVKAARTAHASPPSVITPGARAGPGQPREGKVMGLLRTLEGMKSGLDTGRVFDGLPNAGVPRLGGGTGV
jgi:uncharacterized protein YdaU (DUF1376 family)